MKASVQYNDLKGTAAADVSDFYHSSLQKYLVESYATFDGNRYECKGCTLFVSGQQKVPQGTIRFVCWDKEEGKYVKFTPKRDMTLEEIFSLFKRFEVVIGEDIANIEFNEDYYLDLE